jgi:hypothetical protein
LNRPTISTAAVFATGVHKSGTLEVFTLWFTEGLESHPVASFRSSGRVHIVRVDILGTVSEEDRGALTMLIAAGVACVIRIIEPSAGSENSPEVGRASFSTCGSHIAVVGATTGAERLAELSGISLVFHIAGVESAESSGSDTDHRSRVARTGIVPELRGLDRTLLSGEGTKAFQTSSLGCGRPVPGFNITDLAELVQRAAGVAESCLDDIVDIPNGRIGRRNTGALVPSSASKLLFSS